MTATQMTVTGCYSVRSGPAFLVLQFNTKKEHKNHLKFMIDYEYKT